MGGLGKHEADRGEGLRVGFPSGSAKLRSRVGLLRGRVLSRERTGLSNVGQDDNDG